LAFVAASFTVCPYAAEQKHRVFTTIGDGHKGGWLGVSIQDITPKIAKKKDLKNEDGAYVNDVVEKSPADSAGVKDGDVVTEFNGKKIDDADDLLRAVQKAKPGTKTTIVVLRNNEKKSLDISVGKLRRKDLDEDFAVTAPRAPRMEFFRRSGMWGLQLSELNEQLGEYFGAPKGKGLLVEKVEKKSTGEKAGFKAGDVITKINKSSVEEIRDLNEASEDVEEGDKLEVEVLRKGASKILTIEIEDKDIEPSSFNFQFDIPPDGEMMQELHMNGLPGGDIENLKMQLRRSLPDMRDLHRRIEQIKKEMRHVTV
jgi:S1-C subfamily serine protease